MARLRVPEPPDGADWRTRQQLHACFYIAAGTAGTRLPPGTGRYMDWRKPRPPARGLPTWEEVDAMAADDAFRLLAELSPYVVPYLEQRWPEVAARLGSVRDRS